MKDIRATNIDELFDIWKSQLEYLEEGFDSDSTIPYVDDSNAFKNINIDFDIDIPFCERILRKMHDTLFRTTFTIRFSNCTFSKQVSLQYGGKSLEFVERCCFLGKVQSNGYKHNLLFSDSTIKQIDFSNAGFGKDNRQNAKVRFRNCTFHLVNFNNTKFYGLTDFWKSTFIEPIIFFKTDFNDTVVFSSAEFKKNVLFTYTLFLKNAIFGRTKFNRGVDFSQSIISGDLKLFSLEFEHKNYIAEYIGNDDKKFERYTHEESKIPLINKVGTFQILKNQFGKQGNHIDEVGMRKQEKIAYSELVKSRRKDPDWVHSTNGDLVILFLNKLSNNYKSDFRRGFLVTLIFAAGFLFLTFLTTVEFWDRFCLNCEFDSEVISYSLESFVNFLNPTHSIDYLKDMRPFYGTSYVIDFFGRIAVGYGIYQTIQAFRKYK